MARTGYNALVAVCAAASSYAYAEEKPDLQVDVDLVTIACEVNSPNGTPAADLKAEDFRVLDSGQPRGIRNFWKESDLPLTVALVADVSGSQAGFIRGHRESVGQFFKQVMSPADRAPARGYHPFGF